MTKVLGVIGARLNSSRLPRKHLLDLAGQPIIARIFQRLEQIPELDRIVLATTADDYNQPLVQWAQQAGKEVFSFEGDVNDLVGRVDAVVKKYEPEIVVYFCGDSPLIESETVSLLIRGLQDSPSTDIIGLTRGPEGQRAIHEGFNPYPIHTWKRMVSESVNAHHREHVGSAIAGYAEELNKLELPDKEIFYQLEHRLSVDTPSDYRFMAEVYRRWYAGHADDTIVSLPWVIAELLRDESLRSINAEVKQKAVTEHSVKTLIVTQCGGEIGLGHLSRMLVLTRTLQDHVSAGVKLLIQGDVIEHPELNLVPHQFIPPSASLKSEVIKLSSGDARDAVIFDLAPAIVPGDFGELVEQLQSEGVVTIAIDGLLQWAENFDAIHIPSFYLADENQALVEKGKLSYGWDHYLVSSEFTPVEWKGGVKVLVLTGGSDVAGMGELWPELLDEKLPAEAEVIWVQGPYAKVPNIPARPRLKWRCEHDPTDLVSLMRHADYSLSLYGVSFFEVLQQGIPSVTWTPNVQLNDEMKALSCEGVTCVANSPEDAIDELVGLMGNASEAKELSEKAKEKLVAGEGARHLAMHIIELVEQKA